jgi:hypothetical protein
MVAPVAKQPTRAMYYGVKPKALAAKSARLLAKARAAIAEVSVLWDENFQDASFEAEMIIEAIDKMPEVLAEGVAYLNETPDGDSANG